LIYFVSEDNYLANGELAAAAGGGGG